MIGFANTGGGRDRLRLRVFSGVGSPSVTAPMENDIWVNTSTAVSGYEFSETDHPSWEKTPGFVYFTSTYSGGYDARNTTGLDFFRKNDNSNFTKLLACWQYAGGSWTAKAAYIYHGGTWHQFSDEMRGVLFYKGDQHVELTGGYASTGLRMYGWTDGEWMGSDAPVLEIGTDMKIYQANNPKFGTVFTNKMLDVSACSKLCVDLEYNILGKGFNNGFGIHLTKTNTNGYNPLVTYFVDTAKEDKSYNGVVTMDLSGVSGNVYLAISSHRHSHLEQHPYNTVTIRKIWLE